MLSEAPPPETLVDLGVEGCLYLASLLGAQHRRLPLAPTRRMTISTLEWLRHRGLIEVLWSERPLLVPDTEFLPIEQLQWRFCWNSHLREGLLEALEDCLEIVPRSDEGLEIRCQLWADLAFAESEQFFEQQLSKHHFDTSWSQDFGFAYKAIARPLSGAQWRYCLWAATRHGASVAIQNGPKKEGIREAIYGELQRRARKILSGELGGCSLPPGNQIPNSAMGRIFSNNLCRLGRSYWSVPNSEVLFERGLAPSFCE